MKEYTLEEVSKHTTPNDLWLIVDNKVYDVSTFIEKHPGGQKPFLYLAGKDATEKFNSITKHSRNSNLPKFMESLCIGKLCV